MINLCFNLYILFQILISDNYEYEFLELKNQRGAVITLGLQMIESVFDMGDMCSCGNGRNVMKKCIKVLANIFINNYTKVLNEINISNQCKKTKVKRTEKNEESDVFSYKVIKQKELKFKKN